jgi:hypothetical protein
MVYLKNWGLGRLRLRLKPVVAVVNAVADASAGEVANLMEVMKPLKRVLLVWKVVVVVDVDASRVNLAAALESTHADTAGELLVDCGR